jgi:phytoene synthase
MTAEREQAGGGAGTHAAPQEAGADALTTPAAARSSFYMAMRLLPAPRRAAMVGIYAFCRAVDDIADGAAPAPVRRAALERWRADIRACCAGTAPAPLAAHLADLAGHVKTYGLAGADFEAVIDGMLMDAAAAPLCAPPAAVLDLYCDRVASAVGRLSVKVFGMPDSDGVLLAHHLGRALQLTNILRDIDEDAAVGRVYLPREPLLEAGVVLDAAAGGRTAGGIVAHPALARACMQVAAQAQEHFDAARRVMRGYPASLVRTPRLMGALYHGLLLRLCARGWACPRAPVRVGKLARVGILLRHAVV